MSEYQTTTQLATVALLSTSLTQAIAATCATKRKDIVSNAAGSVACGIAFIHYTWLSQPGCDSMAVRYSDWFLTLPILLFDVLLIGGVDLVENKWLSALCVALLLAMVVAGWGAVRSHRAHPNDRRRYFIWLGVGFACLLTVYYIVFSLFDHPLTSSETLPMVTMFFFLLWAAYGLVAALPRHILDESATQRAYDVLDIGSKAVFGMAVAVNVLS